MNVQAEVSFLSVRSLALPFSMSTLPPGDSSRNVRSVMPISRPPICTGASRTKSGKQNAIRRMPPNRLMHRGSRAGSRPAREGPLRPETRLNKTLRRSAFDSIAAWNRRSASSHRRLQASKVDEAARLHSRASGDRGRTGGLDKRSSSKP